MGCDIHLVLERRADDGRWIAIDTFTSFHRSYVHSADTMDGFSSPIARDRNYTRFAKLACAATGRSLAAFRLMPARQRVF
jgi:hypothetical protein